MAVSDDGQLAALRRQLGKLQYDAGGLTPAAAPLVAALLGDLLKATDSYRSLHAQAGDAGQAAQTLQYQVDVLKREAGRLTAENSRLHQDLLAEADARGAQQAAAYKQAKRLEAQAAEAQFAKQQALERAAGVERERDGLRGKVRDLLSFGQHHEGEDLQAAFTRISLSKPLESRPSPAAQAKTSRGAISLIKAADGRILALEADVRRREGELQALAAQLQQAKDALAGREGEVARLSAQLAQGPDVDTLAQRYRNDANEAVILQLNQQVEALTVELVGVQQRAVDRGELEAAEAARQQAEARANALTAEREGIAREVEAMQAALVRLQQEAAGEGAARAKLGRLRALLEGVRAEKALLEGQLTHAETKVAELRDRLEQREAALRKSQNWCKLLEGEGELTGSQKREQQQHSLCSGSGKAGGGNSSSQPGAAQAASLPAEGPGLLTEQLEEARRQQQEAAAAAAAAGDECRQLQEQVAQLQQQLAEAAAAAGTAGSGQAAPGPDQQGAAEAVAGQQGENEEPADDGQQSEQEQAAQQQTPEQQQQQQQQSGQKVPEVEQREYAELLVKLEESERQVAALTAALAKQLQPHALAQKQQQQPLHSAEGPGDGDSKAEWRLAAGTASGGGGGSGQQAVEAERQREEETRLQVQQLQERVLQLEGQAAGLTAELAAARAGAGGVAVADAAAADLHRQLQERSQEVADLSALSIKADSTVQQYMAQLRSMATEMRAAELRLGDAETELARRAEEAQRREGELSELRGIVGALDAERDSLQAELDRRAEVAAAEAGVLAADRQRAEETERALAASEARLAAAHTRLQEQEQAGQRAAAELEAMGQHLAGMDAEYAALREEYRAVTDDLAALVVSNQLSGMTAERQELADQVKLHRTRCHYNEQLARAREQDVSELRTSYEGLSHENQRMQQSLTELTRELQARDTELATKAEEVGSLHEAQRSAQSQINMYIADLQAYERQLEAANRAMQRGGEAADGLDRERQALLEQLRAAEQVRFQLERAQEGLQRQLVHAEGGIGVLEARLADAQSDGEALKQRIALEQARVGELEGLLAIARADQFKRDAVAAESGADRQVAALQEQRRLLEEQAATLQRQVDGLVQRREAQDEELAQLRAQLAGEFGAGATSGSREAQKRSEALAAQLAEAQQRCSEYAGEAEALRGEAARLAGARDRAQAALEAAQAELEEVKGLLVQGADTAGSADVALAARLVHLEAHNRQLAQQLEAGRADVGEHLQSAEDIRSGLAEVQQENERLLELVSHLDLERTRLSRERQELLAQLQGAAAAAAAAAAPAVPGDRLWSSVADYGGGQPAAATAAAAAAAAAAAGREESQQPGQGHLEGELQRERQLRLQAERDFQELLGSLDLLHSPSPTTSSTCGTLHQREAGTADAAAAGGGFSELQAVVSQLQQENEQLRADLQRTRGSMQGLQAGYSAAAAASSSLQHIAQGLQSIGSGGRGSSGGVPADLGGRGASQTRAGRSGARTHGGAYSSDIQFFKTDYNLLPC